MKCLKDMSLTLTVRTKIQNIKLTNNPSLMVSPEVMSSKGVKNFSSIAQEKVSSHKLVCDYLIPSYLCSKNKILYVQTFVETLVLLYCNDNEISHE